MRRGLDHPFLTLVLLSILFTSCGRSSDQPAPGTKTGPGKTESAPLKDEIPSDKLVAVAESHYKGMGHMERYEYHDAAVAFRRVRELAPGWIPGSINLAIALLNDTGNQAEEARKAGGGESATASRCLGSGTARTPRP